MQFQLETAATSVHPGERLAISVDGGQDVLTDGVVLATDGSALQRIVGRSPGMGDFHWRTQVSSLRAAPPFLVQRLWLDRPVHPDRPAFLGTGGLPPVDNVSVLDRYEREAIEWSSRTGGSVVELHSYAITHRHEDLRDRLLARLHELFSETAEARIVHEVLLCRNDCPRFAPGDFAERPGVATPHPRVVLAGDGIRIDLPVALMERAATTGWTAANRLLSEFGIAGHTLHTVPTRGRSAILRRVASSGGRSRR